MNSFAAIVTKISSAYPDIPPYDPDNNYPEYPFKNLTHNKNPVYENIRRLFFKLNFDIENYERSTWNPLGQFIKPGNTVLIKPNWVNHLNRNEDQIDALISHSSMIRAILDYILIALDGKGRIIIGDAPIQSCDFSELTKKACISDIVQFLQPLSPVKIEIKDFRKEVMIPGGRSFIRMENEGSKFVDVNLKESSFLNGIKNDYKKFRVTSYDKDKMLSNHNEQDHIYKIAYEVLNSDVVIEIPKLKTHRKVGFTCCLKNNVGINAVKDCLVHHRKTSIEEGGDAYPRKNIYLDIRELLYERYYGTDNRTVQLFYKGLLKIIKQFNFNKSGIDFSEGDWFGNDTVWRMILDLNRIVFYADTCGIIKDTPQRIVLYLVDGIIGGEGEGPLKPDSVHSGIMAFGNDPVLVDSSMASLMGFDMNKIPLLTRALENKFCGYGFNELQNKAILMNGSLVKLCKIQTIYQFTPPLGWKNHIEKLKPLC